MEDTLVKLSDSDSRFIVQMLDRFVEARIKKDLRDESGVTARKKSSTSD